MPNQFATKVAGEVFAAMLDEDIAELRRVFVKQNNRHIGPDNRARLARVLAYADLAFQMIGRRGEETRATDDE